MMHLKVSCFPTTSSLRLSVVREYLSLDRVMIRDVNSQWLPQKQTAEIGRLNKKKELLQ